MAVPDVASREEWLEARKSLLAKEKEATRTRDELSAERRRLPMVRVDEEYVFDGPDGKTDLAGMFEGRRQLVVYHFMFDPDWDEGCPACSFLCDNIGHLAHLHARDTTLAAVSRAPLAKLQAYRERMGWTFPWYSSAGSSFNYDFHVTLDESVAPVEYNFRTKAELEAAGQPWHTEGEQHGVSAFLREGDEVYHTYSTYGRGGDLLIGTYNYLDITALGRQEAPGQQMAWLRRHDSYDS